MNALACSYVETIKANSPLCEPGGGGGSVGVGETRCFVPMKNTICAQDKASAVSGKEQLQLTVFTARYLLGQVKASSV